MLFPGVKGFVKHLDGIYKFKCPGDEKDTGEYFYWGGDDGAETCFLFPAFLWADNNLFCYIDGLMFHIPSLNRFF